MISADLVGLARRAVSKAGYEGLQGFVEKEIRHWDILHVMARSGLLSGLVFHGGTSLRLCHGGVRLSEDLDLCTGGNFPRGKAATLATELRTFLTAGYGLPVRVAEPKPRAREGVRVWCRWIRMETEPGHTNTPRQRIKLKFADVPARRNEARSLSRIHDVMATGFEDSVVLIETREGSLADKVVSFPTALPTCVRWRDIWEMRWLDGRAVSVDAALVRTKASDYGIESFHGHLAAAVEQVPGLVRSGGLAEKLGHFLPPEFAARTLQSDLWLEAVAVQVRELLEGLHRDLAQRGAQTCSERGSRRW